MHKKNNGSTALHFACFRDDPDVKVVKLLVERGGKGLLMIQDNDGDTALHWTCQHDVPNLGVVKALVHGGGRELVMTKNYKGQTTLDWAKDKDKEGELYKYFIQIRDHQFSSLVTTDVFVSASSVDQYITEHGSDCLFQTNDTNMIPLHRLAINQSAVSDAIQFLIDTMLRNKPKDINDVIITDLMMNIIKDTAATDCALQHLIALVPNLSATLLRFYNQNPLVTPRHAAHIRKLIHLYQRTKETYFCKGIYAPWKHQVLNIQKIINRECIRRKPP